MKKIISTTIIVALGIVVLTASASAATTVSLSPAGVNVAQGQNFNVVISINPQGVNNYAEKVELNYPADILQVNSFTLGGTWMALTQPGYDLIDNTGGVLIKSAGYPAGFSSATTFGTVSFYAKKAGNGTIKLGSNSLAFEVGSQSALIGAPVSFTITAPAITAPKQTAPQSAPSPSKEPIVEQSQDTLPSTASNNNRSLIAGIGGFVSNLSWLTLIFGIFIGLVFGVMIGKKFISGIHK